ncbi:MAG: hypothetical protein RI907_980 [Pseudomonadota bacterium]
MSIPARKGGLRHSKSKANRAWVVAMAASAFLAACGGGGGGSSGGDAGPSGEVSNPLDQALADDAVSVSGVNLAGFNGSFAGLTLTLASGAFNTDSTAGLSVSVNGTLVDVSATLLQGNTAQATLVFEDGPNEIVADAVDAQGRPVHVRQMVWSGSNAISVPLQDGSAQAWAASTTVTASPSEDLAQAASAVGTSAVNFTHLPSRSAVLLQARSGMAMGVASVVASNGAAATLTLLDMAPKSAVDNLDFSKTDLSGWSVTGQSAQVTAGDGGASDRDLLLSTHGQTQPQVARHAFETPAGAQSVTVRYRYATSEDLQATDRRHADFFRLQLRTQAGQVAADTQTIWSLGANAFDSNGRTAWRALRVATNPAGDLVNLDAIVGNVFDGSQDSQLQIDSITVDTAVLKPSLAWDATQGGLTLATQVAGAPTADQAVRLYWAQGPNAAQKLGSALATLNVPQATASGASLSAHVDGALLAAPPAGATHLLAVVDDAAVAALADVRLLAGPNANLDTLGEKLTLALKAAARRAGVSQLAVAMTGMKPAELAHAMFLNLTRSSAPMADNVASQNQLFGAAGQAVIQVFSQQTQGKSLTEVLAARSSVEAAMTLAIEQQGPTQVLKHCADPSKLLIADVRKASLPDADSAARFQAALIALGATVADEAGRWHVQLALP